MVCIGVTGIGLITALGNREETWNHLRNGISGIVSSPSYPLARVSRETSSAHRVKDFLEVAVAEALETVSLPPDCAVVVGSSRSYQCAWEQGKLILPAMLSTKVAQSIQTQGPVFSLSAACATGNWVIAKAFQLLQAAEVSCVIVAATDSALSSLSLAGFAKMGALSRSGCYPFSQERDGLVLGEGAAALVLQRVSPGDFCYGEVVGIGLTNDAFHITTPDPIGNSAQQAIAQCLRMAGIPASTIGVISPHGTATPLNDAVEALILERLFPHAPWIVPSKGATGHVLGATGLIEAAFCLLMLQRQEIFPSVGLRTPGFPLNFSRQINTVELQYALNISFGFGGQNAVVCFRKSLL